MANLYDKPVNLDFINTYVSPDFGMLMKAGATMQGKSDQAQATEEQMEDRLLQVNALRQDKDERDRLTTEYEDAISKKLEEEGGSYYKIAPFIKEQRKKLHRDLTRGKLGQMGSNYKQWADWTEKNQERADKGEINAEDWQIAQEKALKEYAGVGDAGDLQGIGLHQMIKANDFHGDALKIGGMMKGSKTGKKLVSVLKGQGLELPVGHYERLMRSTKELTEQEIYDNVLHALQSDPKYKAELDQHTNLKQWQLTSKEGWKGWLEEKGGLTETEAKEMEAGGLNSNNFDDIEAYVKGKQRDEFRNSTLRAASAVAARTFDYKEIDDQIIHYKDDAAIQGMLEQRELQGNAFGSRTGAEAIGFDIDEIQSNIAEDEESVVENTAVIFNEIEGYGLGNLLGAGNPYLADGATDVEKLDELQRMLNTGEGANAIASKMLETTDLTPEQIQNKISDLKDHVVGLNSINAKLDQDKGIINSANRQALAQIKPQEWDTAYGKYTSAGGNLSKEAYIEGISNATSEKEIKALFPTKIEDEDAFVGDQLMSGISPTAGKAFPTISGLLGGAFNTAADYIPGGNAVKNVQRLTDANYVAQEMWEKKAKSTADIAEEGYAQFYTKLDLTNSKGIPNAVSRERSSATEAISDPKTSIVVNGMDTNILKAFDVKAMEDLGELESDIIFDKGKPFFIISADVGGESKTILAEVPGRAGSVHNIMKALVGANDNTVKLGAKTYLGAEAMGDFWKPERVGLLKIGDKPFQLRTAQGEPLGSVVREGANYRYLDLEGKETVGVFTDPDDIAREVYSAIYE